MQSISSTALFYSEISEAAETLSELINDCNNEYKDLQLCFSKSINYMACGESHVAFQHLAKLQSSIEMFSLEADIKCNYLRLNNTKMTQVSGENIACETGNNVACSDVGPNIMPIIESNLNGTNDNSQLPSVESNLNTTNDDCQSESASSPVTECTPQSKIMPQKKRGRGKISRKPKNKKTSVFSSIQLA